MKCFDARRLCCLAFENCHWRGGHRAVLSFARLMSKNEDIRKIKLLMQQSLSHGAPSPKLSKMLEKLQFSTVTIGGVPDQAGKPNLNLHGNKKERNDKFMPSHLGQEGSHTFIQASNILKIVET
ncbi:hypothetical protein NC651_030585 [Populus alba x Populus x berolinensis]|nr:hypothetical protein NC651_030585 [Populus alba x Populus x berolinensis]